jgi:uncharacterized protein YndB with AHSA1/START domain
VEVRRRLAAPPEAVYDEWLDPEALRDWMCPRPARATKIELQPHVGGRFRLDIEESGVAFSVTGTYLDLERPRRLSFTWSCSTWPDPDLETLVTVTLEPHGAATTEMTIRHTDLPPKLRADHDHGWTLIAEQLDRALEHRQRELPRDAERGQT